MYKSLPHTSGWLLLMGGGVAASDFERPLAFGGCALVFGLWRVCFPPCLVRPGRRLPVQGLSEGSLGCLDRLPA